MATAASTATMTATTITSTSVNPFTVFRVFFNTRPPFFVRVILFSYYPLLKNHSIHAKQLTACKMTGKENLLPIRFGQDCPVVRRRGQLWLTNESGGAKAVTVF